MLCGTFFSRTSTTEVKVKLYYLPHTIVISLPLHRHALQLAGVVFRAIFLANYTQNQNQSYNRALSILPLQSLTAYIIYMFTSVLVSRHSTEVTKVCLVCICKRA